MPSAWLMFSSVNAVRRTDVWPREYCNACTTAGTPVAQVLGAVTSRRSSVWSSWSSRELIACQRLSGRPALLSGVALGSCCCRALHCRASGTKPGPAPTLRSLARLALLGLPLPGASRGHIADDRSDVAAAAVG